MEDFDLESFIPYRMAVAAADISQEFSKIYRQTHNLTRADWRILCHLSQARKGKKISVRDLEERTHLEKSKVSRSVSRLEQRGMVEKLRDKSDQRLLIIQLTPKGRKIFSEIVPLAKTYNQKLSSMLGDDANRFLAQLDQLCR